MEAFIGKLGGWVYSDVLVFGAFFVAFFFTIMTKGVNFSCLKNIKLLFEAPKDAVGISSFQAFCIAIGEKVGVGNIAGVALAIYIGGPGAVFYLWLFAILGGASAFIEGTLAQLYKYRAGEEYVGGMSSYFEKVYNKPMLTKIVAGFCLLAYGLLNPGAQMNTISVSMTKVTGLPGWVWGALVCIILLIVVLGGVKRIGDFSGKVVPFMTAFYMLAAIIIFFVNLDKVPWFFSTVFSSAFNRNAIFGGMMGLAIQQGVQRGVWSNGAGGGIGSTYAATANVSHPVKQGMATTFAVYVDTLLVCSATAFMLLLTGCWNVQGPDGTMLQNGLPGIEVGVVYVQYAFDTLINNVGSWFVAISVLFFAFTSILGQYYYGEIHLQMIIKSLSEKTQKNIKFVFSIVFVALVFIGAVRSMSLTWSMADVGVGMILYINLVMMLLLYKPAIRALRDFEAKRKQGIPLQDISFKGSDIGLKLECWPDD
ncbi:MAG: alanine/glycine:cation symporter family protein [Clostridiaceae bacterium]|jgi:AGCS family alanine or glycine:cation symporter|nr:alanine/glycine:cation symporter family protein [Clostridiaceae bacterium]